MTSNNISSLYTPDNTLPKRVNDFLRNLRSQEKSEGTVDGYKMDLTLMLKFMKALKSNISLENRETIRISDIDDNFIKDIEVCDFTDFINYLDDIGNSPNTKNRKISAIKSFYIFLVKNRILTNDENISTYIDTVKPGERQPIYLTLDESILLLQAVETQRGYVNYERDLCIMTLFLHCGLRVSELKDIDIKNIRNDILSVIGKGNKQRQIYLNESCIKVINEWLKIRNQISTNDKDALFLSTRRTRIGKTSVEEIVKKYVALAGLDKKYSCHKLRHTAASLMLEGGANIKEIQETLGHSNLSTTQIYVHIGNEKLKKAVSSNPLNNLANAK